MYVYIHIFHDWMRNKNVPATDTASGNCWGERGGRAQGLSERAPKIKMASVEDHLHHGGILMRYWHWALQEPYPENHAPLQS